jgi:hypothetical protein
MAALNFGRMIDPANVASPWFFIRSRSIPGAEVARLNLLWRRYTQQCDWQWARGSLAQLPATGIYSDTNVVPGTAYTYWASAYDEAGRTSCVLGPAIITTEHDSVPPEGVVSINGSAHSTDDPNVTLTLEATIGTTQMQVRNDASTVVTVDSTDMELGEYNGEISVSADGAGSSPQTVALTLVIQEDAPPEESALPTFSTQVDANTTSPHPEALLPSRCGDVLPTKILCLTLPALRRGHIFFN